tara:strand:- start:342 stop:581 length:240 start_codon:yes stop_codon:yes gene_type:complete
MLDSDIQKLNSIFKSIFDLSEETNVESLSNLSHPSWDSLAQVSLISAIANEFCVEIEGSEFEMFTSYRTIKLLLESKGI